MPATDETAAPTKLSELPDDKGRFGDFGGVYVPETLVAALTQLEELYAKACRDGKFWDDLRSLLKSFVGRHIISQSACNIRSKRHDVGREVCLN